MKKYAVTFLAGVVVLFSAGSQEAGSPNGFLYDVFPRYKTALFDHTYSGSIFLPLERIKNGMAMQDNYCYNLRESLKTPTMEDDGNYTIHSYIALAGVVSGIILYYGSLPDYSQANRQEQEAIQDQIWRQVHKDMEYGQFVNNSDNKFWKYK